MQKKRCPFFFFEGRPSSPSALSVSDPSSSLSEPISTSPLRLAFLGDPSDTDEAGPSCDPDSDGKLDPCGDTGSARLLLGSAKLTRAPDGVPPGSSCGVRMGLPRAIGADGASAASRGPRETFMDWNAVAMAIRAFATRTWSNYRSTSHLLGRPHTMPDQSRASG